VRNMDSNVSDSVPNKRGGVWIDEINECRRGTRGGRASMGSHLTDSKDVIQRIPTIKTRT
jgi:hypothetical protein